MVFNTELGYDPALGTRVCRMMAHLQETNDPRYAELLDVHNRAREGVDPKNIGDSLNRGHRALFNHVEGRYSDLYLMIQTSDPDLD